MARRTRHEELERLKRKNPILEEARNSMYEQSQRLEQELNDAKKSHAVLEAKYKSSLDAQERYRDMIRRRTDTLDKQRALRLKMSQEAYDARRASIAATLMSTMSRTLVKEKTRAEAATREADLLLSKLGLTRPASRSIPIEEGDL